MKVIAEIATIVVGGVVYMVLKPLLGYAALAVAVIVALVLRPMIYALLGASPETARRGAELERRARITSAASRAELADWAKQAAQKWSTWIFVPDHLPDGANYPAQAAVFTDDQGSVVAGYEFNEGELRFYFTFHARGLKKLGQQEFESRFLKSPEGEVVTVRGKEGKYVHASKPSADQRHDLAWWEGPVVVSVNSPHHGLEELLKVANSLVLPEAAERNEQPAE
jgi:hypothetical protein